MDGQKTYTMRILVLHPLLHDFFIWVGLHVSLVMIGHLGKVILVMIGATKCSLMYPLHKVIFIITKE
jgi:hypothetical protein